MRYRCLGARLLLAASVILLLGCGENTRTPEAAADPARGISISATDSSGVRVISISGSVETLPEWSLSDTALTEVRSDAAPFIGSVGEVAFVGQQNLLVEDNQSSELRVFTPDGQVLRLLGKRGDGPGEFRMITKLSVTPGDTAYAFDLRPPRMSMFDPTGELVSTQAIPDAFGGRGTFVVNGWALGSDRFLLFGKRLDPGEAGGARRSSLHLLVRDGIVDVVSSDGTPLVPPIQLPGASLIFGEGFAGEAPFSNRPFVTVNGNRIITGSGRHYELTIRDLDLRPVMLIRWSGWAKPMTESVIESSHDPMKASLEPLRSKVPANVFADQLKFLEYFFRAELLPDTLPALRSVLLDEDGRIWVARFRPPDDFAPALTGDFGADWHQEDIWHVLDADGEPTARLRLPPETRLVAVRSDRVATVTRNSLGAETVRVLRINETGAP